MYRHLRRRYECYWYRGGSWEKVSGFPAQPDDWKRLKGVVVRRCFTVKEALAPGFVRKAATLFADLDPLYRVSVLAE